MLSFQQLCFLGLLVEAAAFTLLIFGALIAVFGVVYSSQGGATPVVLCLF